LGDVSQEGPRNPGEALSHYSASLALVMDLAMRPLEAHVHLSLGQLHCRENQIEKARAELSLALGLYHSMEMLSWAHAADQANSSLLQ